jgi:flagellar hook-associated protein 3 FlgL
MSLNISPTHLVTHKRITGATTDSYRSIDKLSKQISSQKQYDQFSEVDPHTLRVLQDLETETKISETRIQNNILLDKRLGEYENTLSSLRDVLDETLNFVQIAKNPASGRNLPISDIANSFINQVKGFLNKTYEGRHIFSGSKTDVAPVEPNVALISNISANGTISANYYRGDNVTPTQQISEFQTIDYAITANNETFQKFFAALHLTKKFEETKDYSYIAKTNDLLQDVKHGLSNMLSVIGSHSDNIRRSMHDESMSLKAKKELKSSIIDTDIPTASTEFALKQAKLQALFMLTAKTADMSILGYLK